MIRFNNNLTPKKTWLWNIHKKRQKTCLSRADRFMTREVITSTWSWCKDFEQYYQIHEHQVNCKYGSKHWWVLRFRSCAASPKYIKLWTMNQDTPNWNVADLSWVRSRQEACQKPSPRLLQTLKSVPFSLTGCPCHNWFYWFTGNPQPLAKQTLAARKRRGWLGEHLR